MLMESSKHNVFVRGTNEIYLIGREVFYTIRFTNTTLKISLLRPFDGIRVSKKISKEITKLPNYRKIEFVIILTRLQLELVEK